MRRRLLGAGLGALLLTAALPAQAGAPPLPAPARAGDLIFRQGTEAVSHLVRAVDQGVYSHVGLLVGGPGHWQVLHATPSERAGAPDAVVLDSLDFFLDPARARAYAVDQVQGASATLREQVVAWALAQRGRPFALREDDVHGSIYCTTLVWQAWQRLGLDWQVAFTRVELPLLGGSYLLPSALARSPRLQRLVFAAL